MERKHYWGLSLVAALRQQDLPIGRQANISRRTPHPAPVRPDLTVMAHLATLALAFCALALIFVPAMAKPWYQGGKWGKESFAGFISTTATVR